MYDGNQDSTYGKHLTQLYVTNTYTEQMELPQTKEKHAYQCSKSHALPSSTNHFSLYKTISQIISRAMFLGISET
jgi:hypothetical protein